MSKQVYRVEIENRITEWYDFETGKHHNESGPAVVTTDGYKAYYIYGTLHNKSGPAIVRSSGDKEYWIHGQRHNESGPAVMWANGMQEYWIHGKELTESEFLARNKTSCEEKTIVVDGHTYRLVKTD